VPDSPIDPKWESRVDMESVSSYKRRLAFAMCLLESRSGTDMVRNARGRALSRQWRVRLDPRHVIGPIYRVLGCAQKHLYHLGCAEG
jgi:hypothetical protein